MRTHHLMPRFLRWWQAAGNFAVFVLPGLAIFTAVVFIPILWTLLIGLTNERASRPVTSFVGLDNYLALIVSSSFRQVLSNTVVITLIVVVGTNIIGLLIALLLRGESRLYGALRSVFFTPVVLSAVVVSVIWRSLLVDDGLLNSLLRSAGVAHPPGWLSDPTIALYSLSGIIVWQMLGFAIVVYLAGLAAIPKELDEASRIDGAGPLAHFRHVTWPLLAPAFTINTVMLMISSFKVFDQVAVLTNGGPGAGTTSTIAFEVVQTAFTQQRAGFASAMAGLMLVIIAVASALALYFLQRREVEY
jgi:multiple sugar transport system permease protein